MREQYFYSIRTYLREPEVDRGGLHCQEARTARDAHHMHFLVFNHQRPAHRGALGEMAAAAGHVWTRVFLHEGTPLPPLDGFDAVWVKGGSMDVWQEEAHPWLRAEKAIIREAVVDRAMPYLGICLGHQLLASALGGEVLRGTPEVGVKTVTLHGNSPFMSDVP